MCGIQIMRGFIAALVLLVFAGCERKQPIHTHGLALNNKERQSLESKAADGDSNAAWRLYDYYSIELHDDTSADPWLRRAAQLGHPEGQRLLAYLIKEYDERPDDFGKSKQDAVLNLLEKSSRTNAKACFDLATAYAEGYFATNDFVKARSYFIQGAAKGSSMCWKNIAEYLHGGIGGKREDAEAYYWISLDARCVHPDSIGGKEIWKLREEIAQSLTLKELESQWHRIDDFIQLVRSKKYSLDSPPFGEGIYQKDVSKSGRQLADKREIEHREALRRRQTP